MAIVEAVMILLRIGIKTEAEMTGTVIEDEMTETEAEAEMTRIGTETETERTRIGTEIETVVVTETTIGVKTVVVTGIRKRVKISIRIKRIKAGIVTEKTPIIRKRRRRRERNPEMTLKITRMIRILRNIKGTMMIMRRDQAAKRVKSPMMGMKTTTENPVPRNIRKVTKLARTTLTVTETKRRKRRRKTRTRTRTRRRGGDRGGVRRRRERYLGTGASGMTRPTPTGGGRRDTEPLDKQNIISLKIKSKFNCTLNFFQFPYSQ